MHIIHNNRIIFPFIFDQAVNWISSYVLLRTVNLDSIVPFSSGFFCHCPFSANVGMKDGWKQLSNHTDASIPHIHLLFIWQKKSGAPSCHKQKSQQSHPKPQKSMSGRGIFPSKPHIRATIVMTLSTALLPWQLVKHLLSWATITISKPFCMKQGWPPAMPYPTAEPLCTGNAFSTSNTWKRWQSFRQGSTASAVWHRKDLVM